MFSRFLLLCLLALSSPSASFAGPSTPTVSSATVLQSCAKAALQQIMIVKRVVSEKTIRDRRGVTVAVLLVMDVNAAGKSRQVNCVYDLASRKARIEAGSAPPPVAAIRDSDVVVECKRAGQKQGFLIEGVGALSDLRDRTGELIGRRTIMSVSRAGKPAKLLCDYHYSSGFVGLELLR